MKRKLCMLLVALLWVAVWLPMAAAAKDYTISGTDMTVTVDNTIWYVFTRDNIQNNPELEELGISYEYMYDVLYDNHAYMDAILFYEDGSYMELFVRKNALEDSIVNLSNYSEGEAREFAKALAEEVGAQDYEVYENTYKFSRMEYVDTNYGYYVCEYATIVNQDGYTLTFQATMPFTDWEYEQIRTIVDSVRFDVDTSLKEPKDSSGEDILVRTIAGAAIGGTVGCVTALTRKKKKKADKNDENSNGNITVIS